MNLIRSVFNAIFTPIFTAMLAGGLLFAAYLSMAQNFSNHLVAVIVSAFVFSAVHEGLRRWFSVN